MHMTRTHVSTLESSLSVACSYGSLSGSLYFSSELLPYVGSLLLMENEALCLRTSGYEPGDSRHIFFPS
jgi:hypothetical protein